jgi:leader peptidase (prepilin peptidase) / N-methyltransferase
MPASSSIAVSIGAFLLLYGVIALITSALSARPITWLACSAILALTLATLSAIDLATFRLPDGLTLPLAVSGLALPWLIGDDISLTERGLATAGAFILIAGLAAAYQRLRGRQGLGLGDAKLFAAAGSWLGAEPLSHVLLWAAASALAAVAVAALRGGALTRETRIAFGPFLAFGFWMAWIGAA